MQRNHFTATSRASWIAVSIVSSILGCERPSYVDRSGYDDDDRHVSIDSADRGRPVARIRNTKVIESSTHDDPGEPVGVRPTHRTELRPIATPVPHRVVSTAEAELTTRHASYAAGSRNVPEPEIAPAADADAKARQADEHCRRGAAAAAKGTWFTARAEYTQAARLLAAALDAREGLARRATAFEFSLAALGEAEEFVKFATGAAPASSLPVVMRGHQTLHRLNGLNPQSSPAALHEAYCRFAEHQLFEAFTSCESASVALHGLGKVYAASGATIIDANSKARCFYEGALSVAPANFLAANDLAVLLADDGRLEQARDVLHAGLSHSSQPAMWKNLAVIHDRMGQAELAQLARREAVKLEKVATATPGAVLPTHNVSWLDPRGFAATGRPSVDAQVASPGSAPRSITGRAEPPAAGRQADTSHTQPIEHTATRQRTPALAY